MSEGEGREHGRLRGRAADRILTPATLAELRAFVRERDGRTLVPAGGGTRLGLGYAPEGPFILLDLREALGGAFDHAPEDLTLVAPAGATIEAINRELRVHGQFVPLDPPLPGQATLGGTLAVGSGGPLQTRYGLPRDLVLGMTVLRADGEMVKAGGRVVKNVTGYDLHRLHTGALGSLGVIVSASFKVAPLPEATAMLALRCPDIQLAERAAFELRDRRLPLRALSLLDASTATTVGVETRAPATTVLAAFEGVPAVVARAERESRDVARRMRAAIEAVPPFTWSALRRRAALAGSEEQTVLVRLGVPPSRVASTLAAVGSGRLEAWAHVAAGCVYVRGASLTAATLLALQADAHAAGGFLQVEHAPAELRDIGDAGDLELTRTLKATFDPEGVLNPGRWGDDA